MLSIQGLFRNLKEQEMELKWFSRNEEDKRKKFLTLKATINFDEDE